MTNPVKEENGQSVVLIALALVAVLAMLGLVYDGANAYAQRRRMQNSADAASLAGARVLALRENNNAQTEQDILTAVNSYATNNGGPTTITGIFIDNSGSQVGAQIGVNGGVPGGATGVRVTSRIGFPTFFLGVINANLGVVAAIAAAQTGEAGPPTVGLMPIGVPRCYVDPNSPGPDTSDPDYDGHSTKEELCGSGDQSTQSHVILGQGAQDPSGSSSYRGIINLPERYSLESGSGGSLISGCSGTNKQDAVDFIQAGGYNMSAACGDPDYNEYIDGLTGNSNGNAGVDGYHDALFNGEPMYPIGTVILLCIYPEGTIGNGTKETVKCIGFAAMRITGYSSNHMDAVFAGKFVQSGPILDSPPDGDWSKRKAIQLIQ